MFFAGAGWGWFGNWWPSLFLVLYFLALIFMAKNSRGLPWLPEKKIMSWFSTLTMAALCIIFIPSLPELFQARSFDGKPIELLFPLQSGTYHIVHGGNTEVMNHHYPIPAQKYALDILKVNSLGVRAKGLMPKDLTDYFIFGEQILAPCSGEILSIENKLKDNIPALMDTKNLLGNHVILFCKGHSILMAHLKEGSVIVEVGKKVKKGSLIGLVGNTGNTSEPHLHLHAVEGKFTKIKDIAGAAKGIPMTFNGRFFIRNDRITYPK